MAPRKKTYTIEYRPAEPHVCEFPSEVLPIGTIIRCDVCGKRQELCSSASLPRYWRALPPHTFTD